MFQRIIDLLSIFGGVFEATRVEGPWCLLKRRCKRGARCRRGYPGNCGDKVEDGVPDVEIGGFVNNKSRQRTVLLVVKAAISNMPEERVKVRSYISTPGLGLKIKCDFVALQGREEFRNRLSSRIIVRGGIRFVGLLDFSK